MGKVALKGIELTGKVGVHLAEHIIGTECIIDVEISTSIKKASATDKLHDAIDYESVLKAVKNCMQQKYDLMEAAARAIGGELLSQFPSITGMLIRVRKIKPLLEANVREVS